MLPSERSGEELYGGVGQNPCCSVCKPGQELQETSDFCNCKQRFLWYLGDVYTEVLEAAHRLHRGPTDHKRSVGLLLSLPEVHNQLFIFAHVQTETVVLAP